MSDGHMECAVHGRQMRSATSPKIAEAVRRREKFPHESIVEYEIAMCFDDPERSDICLVDMDFLKEFIGPDISSKVVLMDRDRKNKRLNDRLLIFRINEHLETVCPRCLELVTDRPTPPPGWWTKANAK